MTTDTFLPNDYNIPSEGGNYLRFIKGENRFRIMCPPILGYEWWKEKDGARKPIRVRMGVKINIEEVDDPESIKHFWAMVVYNYDLKKIQILEITQKGIQRTLRSLSKDSDWGTPVQTYDIVVTRTGDGMETKYEARPKPKSKMDEGIVQLYKDMNINLDALYDGADPFSSNEKIDYAEFMAEEVNENTK